MSPSYQGMIKTLLQSQFPDAGSEQILQAALSKDGSLGPAVLTVSLRNSGCILYTILKVVINVLISEEFSSKRFCQRILY